MTMDLVRIRCASCRRVLHVVSKRPGSWDGSFEVGLCTRCDIPDTDHLVYVLLTTKRAALPASMIIPWSAMKAPIEKAEKYGRPENHDVRVATPDESPNLG